MWGSGTISLSQIPISFPQSSHSVSKPLRFQPILTLNFHPSFPKAETQRNPRKFMVCAEENGNGLNTDPKERGENGDEKKNEGGDEDIRKGEGRPRFSLNWMDLLLDPDPDNIVAVGLTGLLTWASVQVLWQLLLISLAIVVAALKYSFVAALLIFILITLL
ncbi:hypothetical protein RJ639_006298 [Escallonia herrerae]|uniref:Transmembrane protein n=1 Tax=Escallonia herrerae TaxID=1293975 RepID=A0AA88VXS4_9ASTE|nr:hypothetical protein RJ639_006298 [Escallonia herrerae]